MSIDQALIGILNRIRELEDQLNRSKVIEYPTGASGVTGSGTTGRIAEWASASVLQDSTLIKSGAGVLTLSSSGAFTLTVPATGTAALLATENIFTAKQKITLASTSAINALHIEVDWSGSSVSNLMEVFDSYGDTSRLSMRRSNGNKAAPTQILSNDQLGNFSFRGHDGTNFSTGARAAIQANASENFTSTAQGTSLLFYTTPIGTISVTAVMRVTDSGNVTIGNPGVGSSLASGLVFANGTAPTTSVTGSQEWSKSNGLMWMKSGVAAPMGHNGYYGFTTTQTGNTALTETVIGNTEILGSTLSRDGDRITFKASGSFAGTASINKQIVVKFEGSTIFDTGALAITAAADWVLEGEIIRTGATTQKCNVSMATSSAALVAYANYATSAETLANSLTLEIRGNGTNANDVLLEMLTVDFHASPN